MRKLYDCNQSGLYRYQAKQANYPTSWYEFMDHKEDCFLKFTESVDDDCRDNKP